jgi:hypothetical protein
MNGPDYSEAVHPPREHPDELGLNDMTGHPVPFHVPAADSGGTGLTASGTIDRPKTTHCGDLVRPEPGPGKSGLTDRFPDTGSDRPKPPRPSRIPGG